ncbi:hypothetical protein TNCV_2831131 [Trichonephila clavipes]|nr:hypothetical protein TNCV_2831131 [Trichonephila clavipes]
MPLVKSVVERTYCVDKCFLKVSGPSLRCLRRHGKLGFQPGRGRKSVTLVLVDAVKTAIGTHSQTLEFVGRSTRAVSQQTDTIQKVLRKHYVLFHIHNPPKTGAA